VRLRQPQGQPQQVPLTGGRAATEGAEAPVYRAGEFELYVQRLTGDLTLRRFGTDLALGTGTGTADAEVQAPPDYRVAPGDELLVSIWGSVDADLRLTVDRTGRISIPRVGVISVSGLTLTDATSAIDRQARRSFKNYQISVSIGQLRSMRVFVTGFVSRPGAFTVNALSTLSSALFSRAGGPSPAGSFRDIELRRNGRVVAKLDLYDLMLFGRREADQTLQANDVIHVGPVSRQVALIGSVNKPAIFELRSNESIKDLLNMGGGLTSVADRGRVTIERLTERNDKRVRQIDLTSSEIQAALENGDVVRAFSAVDAALPLERQNKRVRLGGEVQRPGTYILPPESTIVDALQMAGGLTPAAYVFGTEFTRDSVRATQQVNYERALRDIELELNRKAASTGARSQEDIAAQAQQQVASDRLIARLRESRPTGRIVLQLSPNARELPALVLEDGDSLYIPPVPSSVGVFGSVFNAGSYLFSERRKVDDYLRLAGSATKGADKDSIFVIRANGSVSSAQQDKTWFGAGNSNLEQSAILPGDTIFVPEEANKTTFLQNAKDWTQILYQMGLGIAAFRTFVP
jgi:protein involved in polysaccharide export with SLBB domain